MHDNNIAFRVQLHRTPMRHRKLVNDSGKPCQPLSHTVLDLMVEFIQSNLRKSFPLHLHSLSLGIILRIICYQKKCNLRFEYHWTEVWSALINLLKFIVNHETDLLKSKHDIFSLALTAVNIFNLFITFGDTFLPSAQTYDQLYYEVIRMHIVFENLYLLGKFWFCQLMLVVTFFWFWQLWGTHLWNQVFTKRHLRKLSQPWLTLEPLSITLILRLTPGHLKMKLSPWLNKMFWKSLETIMILWSSNYKKD